MDSKRVRAIGGSGGDGCVSFLSIWCNDRAGPDGADGGNGGHVVLEASNSISNLSSLLSIIRGECGEKGGNKNCHGKNANHTIVKVPIGTIIRNEEGKVVGDLKNEGWMFVAARGGAGGKGNRFFMTDIEQAPQICEAGAKGEAKSYLIEIRSMANIGLIGFPNAGKSTLLRAVSRAKPKVASYPFTTLQPHIGVVKYSDYEQIAIADLPGIIPGSHKNKGLGIQFLKHIERCKALVFLIDITTEDPYEDYKTLMYELEQFSPELNERPQIIVANKIDMIEGNEFVEFRKKVSVPVLPISAKLGTNLNEFLTEIRNIYNKMTESENNPDHET